MCWLTTTSDYNSYFPSLVGQNQNFELNVKSCNLYVFNKRVCLVREQTRSELGEKVQFRLSIDHLGGHCTFLHAFYRKITLNKTCKTCFVTYQTISWRRQHISTLSRKRNMNSIFKQTSSWNILSALIFEIVWYDFCFL